MGDANHYWEISDSKKKLVKKYFLRFLEPDALNVMHELTGCLSDREMDHIQKIAQLKPNQDVMRQLLDYLFKRPNWWMFFENALIAQGYTDHAKLLGGNEYQQSNYNSSRPSPNHHDPPKSAESNYNSSRPSPNHHHPPKSAESRQQAQDHYVPAAPVQSTQQRVQRPQNYIKTQPLLNHPFTHYHNAPSLPNRQMTPANYQHQAIVQLPPSVLNGNMPYQQMPPPEHDVDYLQHQIDTVLLQQQHLLQQHQHQFLQQRQQQIEAQQVISENSQLPLNVPTGMLKTVMSDQDEKLAKLADEKDDVSSSPHFDEHLNADVKLYQMLVIQEKQQTKENEEFATKTFNNVDTQQHLANKSLPALNNFNNGRNKENIGHKESVDGISKLSFISGNNSTADVVKPSTETTNISSPSGVHTQSSASLNIGFTSPSLEHGNHRDTYFDDKDVGDRINPVKLPVTTLSNSATSKPMGEILTPENVVQDVSTNIHSVDCMISDENNAAVSAGSRRGEWSSLPTLKQKQSQQSNEAEHSEVLSVISEDNSCVQLQGITRDRCGIKTPQSVCYPPSVSGSHDHNNAELYAINTNTNSATSSVCYPPSMPQREMKARLELLQSKELVESTQSVSTALNAISNENNLSQPLSSENSTLSRVETKVINVSQDVDEGQNKTGRCSVKTEEAARVQSLSQTQNIPHFNCLLSSMSKNSSYQQEKNMESSQIDQLECQSEGSIQIESINTMNKKLERPDDQYNREQLQSYLQSEEKPNSIDDEVTSYDFELVGCCIEDFKPKNLECDTVDNPNVDVTSEERSPLTVFSSSNQGDASRSDSHRLHNILPVLNSSNSLTNKQDSFSSEASKQENSLSLPNDNCASSNHQDTLNSEKNQQVHNLPVGISTTDMSSRKDFHELSPSREQGSLSVAMKTLAVSGHEEATELQQNSQQHMLSLPASNLAKTNTLEFAKLESAREQYNVQEKHDTRATQKHSLQSLDMDSLLFGSNHELSLMSQTEFDDQVANQTYVSASGTHEPGREMWHYHTDEVTDALAHEGNQMDDRTSDVSESKGEMQNDEINVATVLPADEGEQGYISSSDMTVYEREIQHNRMGEVTGSQTHDGNQDEVDASDTPGHDREVKGDHMDEITDPQAPGRIQVHDSASGGKLEVARMEEVAAQLVNEGNQIQDSASGGSRYKLESSQMDKAANQADGDQFDSDGTNCSVSQDKVPSRFQSFWRSPFTKVATSEFFSSLR